MSETDDPHPGSASAPPTVALITGATGAIGKAIASRIARNRDYEVVLLCRDPNRAAAAVDEIQRETGNPGVRYETVDLARLDSIRALAERWRGPARVLINNAAVAPRSRRETPEGIELQFATNVLGYFWMTRVFEGVLRESRPARVVNVASYWAGGLDLDDLEFTRRPYNNDQAYRQSKQANRMLTPLFADRLWASGILVNACHPGDVNSTLSNDLGFGGHESPEQGAYTPAWLATDQACRQQTGKYFEHGRLSHCRFAEQREEAAKLYETCLRYC